MSGKIESGQLCTVKPVRDVSTLKVEDIVLCKVNGNEYLHLIKAIQGKRFQMGNNRGFTNGWIGPNSIYGRCIKVDALNAPFRVRVLAQKAEMIQLTRNVERHK